MNRVINTKDYWPWPARSAPIVNYFDSGWEQCYDLMEDGRVRLRETLNGAWQDDWYYNWNPERGVLEDMDYLPKKGFQKLLFWLPSVTQRYVMGYEIEWGRPVEPVDGAWRLSVCRTRGLFGRGGWQDICFLDVLPVFLMFKNVLLMEYAQGWGASNVWEGAKLWLAPGRGIIRAEWMRNFVPTGYAMQLVASRGGTLV